MLKPGGLLLNFDANWYAYLFDEGAQAAYDRDRLNSAEQGVWDQNVGENFHVMDDIARRLDKSGFDGPLTFELNVMSKPGRRDNDIYRKLSAEEYIAEVYKRACRVAAKLKGAFVEK